MDLENRNTIALNAHKGQIDKVCEFTPLDF